MGKRIIWGIGALGLITVVAVGSWWFMGRNPEGVKVRTATAAPSDIHQEVYTTGTVVPVAKQDIRILTPGKVARVAVKAGDSVSPGQTLIQMDTTLADAQVAQAQASVQTAKSNLAAAQANLEAIKNAPQVGVAAASPPEIIQGIPNGNMIDIPMDGGAGATGGSAVGGSSGQATAALKQAEAAVSQAEAMLKQAQEGLKVAQAQRAQNIYTSSLKGTVMEVNAQEGSLASPQAPLVVVADLSKLRVEGELNEVDAGKVQLGQKVDVSSKVIGEIPVIGKVAEIAPQAVSKLSVQGNAPPTVRIFVDLESVPEGLKPGFSVNLKIQTASKAGVLAIPQEALFQEGGKNYVFKVVNQTLKKTEVSLGIVNETLQEITSGLQPEDQVVLNPTSQLIEGMPVQVEAGSAVP